ncbi:glycoside hydrolase family 3 C-terminal domain-containing protein [Oerskovia enterophila]|uniref:glycoside hydrolase family 3 C-terminal domain-containing protein n=1 Tax=Oerskovia enterophila TaxID=43678 RepID=UPI0038110B5D
MHSLHDAPDLARDAPVLDPAEARAGAVLALLTLDEKVAMLHQAAPAVERLGLAPFRTGTEALHGVSWLGTATVFPQPVGLAASWDEDLLTRVGDAVATEVRAKHAGDPSVSLNVWAPVVNPLRHPLWGRGEECFSEDPHLTTELATAYSRGLRGAHPTVWKTVPTLKHFLGYSNEVDRSVTSSHLPPQALREYELPAYQGAVASGAVGAVMPSYNLVNGRPNHVARELLDELRSWAPGSIAVVSDAAAPTNLVESERYFPTHTASHAAALRAGVDSFTDNDADPRLTIERVTAALAAGLVTESDVDRAVLRLLVLRARTGELSPPDLDPYRSIAPDAIDLPEHRALAREAVARGVVVLSNEGVLPLRATPTRVAVVGPHADRVVHDWYSGTPPYTTSIAAALVARYPDAEVLVADGADRVALRSRSTGAYVAVSVDASVLTASSPTASPSTHLDVTDWGEGVLTLRSVVSGRMLTGASWILAADAERIGGWVAQETFRSHRHPDGSWSLQHVGSRRWVRVQHGSGLLVANADDAEAAERFTVRTVRAGAPEVARVAAEADVVLVAVGNDPHVLGRETEDRPHLDLPAGMQEIWRVAHESGRPAVLVVVSSYPYALGPVADEAAAVVWTSHGGQELGSGLVDVLSGDLEPTGRLAQTWWRETRDAGEILDYDVVSAGTTYWYSDADPLYAFGHGLSWSAVAYDAITLSTPGLTATTGTTTGELAAAVSPTSGPGGVPGTSLVATVRLRNTGARPVDELVALYALAPDLPVTAPRRRLVARTRVHLAPGEAASVALEIDVSRLAVWDVGVSADGPGTSTPGAFHLQPGDYEIGTGPSSVDLPVRAPLRVMGAPRPARPLGGVALHAHGFDAYDGVLTSDRTPEEGSAIEVAAGSRSGWARYDGLVLDGVRRATLSVASTAGPGTGGAPGGSGDGSRPGTRGPGSPDGPTVGAVELLVRRAGDRAGTWEPVGRAEVRASGRYAWQDAALDVPDTITGAVDLLARLEGAARLASIRF